MADWEEIRLLAADFRKLQESTTVHKLSERNCIEVVARLISTGQVEVIYTLDGKEYITPQQIEREIKNELIAHRGRINVTDLQTILNIDFSHVENKVTEILKNDRSITFLQGELISKAYIEALCEEINDNLQECGQISVAEVCKNFTLPNSFLLEVIENSLGKRISGELDKSGSGIIYTEAYVCRYRSRIRGLFSAITRRTVIGSIISQGNFQENLFHSVLHELISSRQLLGFLRGHGDKAVYTPDVYIHMQNKWADSFLSSNGYLEYDTLYRLGIDDPQDYVFKRYCDSSKEGDVVQLASCAVGKAILSELEGAIDNIHASGEGWIDVLPLMPTPCTSEDAHMLLHKKYDSDIDLKIFGKFLVATKFVQSCCDLFLPLLKEKAMQVTSEGSLLLSEVYVSHKESELITKTKGGKEKKASRSKSRRGDTKQHKIKESIPELLFMNSKEIAEELSKDLIKCDELCDSIAPNIKSTLQSIYQREVTQCLENYKVGKMQTSNEMKKRHTEVQETVQGLWTSVKLFNKAIDKFDGDAVIQLSKYLLRTLCSDLMNRVLVYLGQDCGLTTSTQELTPKDRSDLIKQFPDHIEKVVSCVHESLNRKDIDGFFELFESLCNKDYCGIVLRKIDRKKERQLIFSHQQSLLQNLQDECDSAMALHIIVVLLFQQSTGSIIHIPGKFVPNLVSFLGPFVPSREHAKLVECQKLIASKWKQQQAQDKAKNVRDEKDVTPEELLEADKLLDEDDIDATIHLLIQDLKQLVVKTK